MTLQQNDKTSQSQGKDIATLAGGCFWCLEAIFGTIEGVEQVESGYAGGMVPNPSYRQVCTGSTGHAESVRITFDPKIIPYRELLHIFFSIHDPTTLNRQGNDVGPQYRSVIFYHNEEQERIAEDVVKELTSANAFPSSIVTQVVPLMNFYPAEDYHRQYFELHGEQPYCQLVIAPKVAKFREHYANRLKQQA